MELQAAEFNHPTAEVIANHIADSQYGSVNFLDIFVVGTSRDFVVNLQYELDGEFHQRILRNLDQAQSFIREPREFTINTSPEAVCWPEMEF